MNRLRSFFVLFIFGMVTFAGIGTPFFYASAQTAASFDPNAGVAVAVQSYFADIPVMIAIAKCESGPRQFASNGSLLYAGTDNLMVGVFQLDSSIHTAPALALGFDITTLAGNMGYARYLYGEDGTEPWISSFACWDSATGAALALDLSLGDIGPQVMVLQQLLNQSGFILTTAGPGSPGNETTKFGALTYAALRKFQCAKGIACSGDESSTGYGLLNAATRSALLAATSGDATSTAVAVATSTATSTDDGNNAAEITELQSRVAALVVILNQLEAELAARI